MELGILSRKGELPEPVALEKAVDCVPYEAEAYECNSKEEYGPRFRSYGITPRNTSARSIPEPNMAAFIPIVSGSR